MKESAKSRTLFRGIIMVHIRGMVFKDQHCKGLSSAYRRRDFIRDGSFIVAGITDRKLVRSIG